jgi:hypothetical protein
MTLAERAYKYRAIAEQPVKPAYYLTDKKIYRDSFAINTDVLCHIRWGKGLFG